MENFTVYMLVSPRGKKYVGITSQPVYKRWSRGYDHNAHLQSAINKYGWDNFQHIVLATHLSKEWACAVEQILINDLKLQDPRYGYNLSTGGDMSAYGIKRSKEFCERISQTHSGKVVSAETREKLRKSHLGQTPWNKGKKTSPEIRQKISLSHKGKGSGHIWVTNGVCNKRILPEDIAEYESYGYVRGMTYHKKEIDYR